MISASIWLAVDHLLQTVTILFCNSITFFQALYEIITLWGSTAAMAFLFYRVNTTAGLLILPYLAWNTFAAALNYVIYRDNELNKSVPAIDEKKK